MPVRRLFSSAALVAILCLGGSLAVAGIFSGKIVSLSATRGSITVEASSGSKKKNFTIPSTAAITLDGKAAKLGDLSAGLLASVLTDSSETVTRLVARREAAASKTATPAEGPADESGETKPSKASKGGKKGAGKAKASSESTGESTVAGWPQFLGPNRSNVSSETGLLKKIPQNGPKLLWTARGLGAGYSAVSATSDAVFTMGNRGQDEYLVALKLDGGGSLWEVRTGTGFRQGQGDGPRSTPTLDGDFVYALGASGDLCCAEAKAGQVSWRKNILSEFDSGNLNWGICESVLIDGDRLICTPGGPGAVMVALDKKTGNVIWKASTPGGLRASYASPIAVDVGGVRQYVQLTSGGTIGVRADDGKVLWGDDHIQSTANCSSPVFYNDMVFSAAGYGCGGAMLKLSSRNGETTASFAYLTKEMKNHHGGMVVLDGCVYGSNDPGILTCLDLKTGKVKWQDRSVGKGSITAADGMVILRSEQGPVAFVQATPGGYRELGRFNPPDRSDRQSWPYPVVAFGKLFLRDQDILQCYDLKGRGAK